MALKGSYKTLAPPDSIEELSHFLDLSREHQRFSDNDIKLIWMAYNYAREAHENQRRD